MAKRPDISIFLLLRGHAYRADFARSSITPSWTHGEELDAEATLADAVATLCEDHPRPAARTIVLSTDVWSQVIALPRLSIAGIEPDELEAALRFEAETLSGIEIDEIALAHRSLGATEDFDQFWVSVLRRDELEAVNAYLQQRGCREIVLAHPAGLGSSAASRVAGVSAEQWGDLVYRLSHNGTRLMQVKQVSAEAFEDSSALLLSSESSLADLPDLPELTVDLRSTPALDAWVGRVANNYLLHLDELVAPRLRKAKPVRGTPLRHVVSVFLALLVVGFCVWHRNEMKLQQQAMIEKIAEIKQPALDKKAYDAQLVAILEDRAEVDAENAKLAEELLQIQFFLEQQSDRIAILLRMLIELRTDDLVIQRIEGTEDGLLISGVSLNGQSAQALAKRLREQAVSLGWMVNPAKQQGQEKLTTGGPWDFKISLTDIGPFDKQGG